VCRKKALSRCRMKALSRRMKRLSRRIKALSRRMTALSRCRVRMSSQERSIFLSFFISFFLSSFIPSGRWGSDRVCRGERQTHGRELDKCVCM